MNINFLKNIFRKTPLRQDNQPRTYYFRGINSDTGEVDDYNITTNSPEDKRVLDKFIKERCD